MTYTYNDHFMINLTYEEEFFRWVIYAPIDNTVLISWDYYGYDLYLNKELVNLWENYLIDSFEYSWKASFSENSKKSPNYKIFLNILDTEKEIKKFLNENSIDYDICGPARLIYF